MQNKERDESFKLMLTGTDCEGATIGRVAKTIVTIINDEGSSTSNFSSFPLVMCLYSFLYLYLFL